MEEYKKFVKLVRAMRLAQQEFFKTRTQKNQRHAMALEAQVDAYLTKVKEEAVQIAQQRKLV